MTERSRTCHIIICGIEREVEVDFNIVSYGSADSWLEPGDPPEIEVLRVMSGDRDITAFCNEVRDLWGDTREPFISSTPPRYTNGVYFPAAGFVVYTYKTLLEAIEEDILDNFHEYESDGDDIGGYDD